MKMNQPEMSVTLQGVECTGQNFNGELQLEGLNTFQMPPVCNFNIRNCGVAEQQSPAISLLN